MPTRGTAGITPKAWRRLRSDRRPGSFAQRKVAIHAPGFRPNSGGIIALHKLCDILIGRGVEAYLVPVEDVSRFRGEQPATGTTITHAEQAAYPVNPDYRSAVLRPDGPLDLGDDWIAIYPEITPGNPFGAKNVVRWLLHDPGRITGNIEYGPGELYFRYREHRSADFTHKGSTLASRLMTVNDYPLHLYNLDGVAAVRSGTAYCMRKGRTREVSHDLTDSISIDDLEHEEIARTFKSVEQFISYDLNTSFLKLAALCGCDVVVMPEPGISEEQWRPDPERRYGVAYGFDRVEWARSTAHLVAGVIDRDLRTQERNVLACIEDMNKHFNRSSRAR